MDNHVQERDSERGTTLIVIIVLMVTVGALVTAHLGATRAEHRKVQLTMWANRAAQRADGELARARNIVNAAPYVAGKNTALQAAVSATPSVIPGTEVLAERIGAADSPWFRLRAQGEYQSVRRFAFTFVRERAPASSYNLFVVDDPVGVSGAPRGAIHSNAGVEFYFPWGTYRDEVTAGAGFSYHGGATPANTRLWGPTIDNAPRQDIFTGSSIRDLASQAPNLAVTDDLLADVIFEGTSTRVDLYRPGYDMQVERTATRSVFDHFDTVERTRTVPIYTDVAYTVPEPVYEDRTVTWQETVPVYDEVQVNHTREDPVYVTEPQEYEVNIPITERRLVEHFRNERIWVDDPPPPLEEIEGGSSVAGGTGTAGHWANQQVSYWVEEDVQIGTRTETRTRQVQRQTGTVTVNYTTTDRVFSHNIQVEQTRIDHVQVGTHDVTRYRREFSHNETQAYNENVPVYRDEDYTYTETQHVPTEFVRTENVPTDGVIYIEGPVRSVSGNVRGKVSLVSNSSIKITGSIRYVDADGDTRMQNGTTPSAPYAANPDFDGPASVLGLISNGDITYSKNAPSKLEINASLMSLNGKVAMEGIDVDAAGTASVANGLDPQVYVKESLRRLGGIVSRKRPVDTFVNAANQVVVGFRAGRSQMDRNLLISTGGNIRPPAVFEIEQPLWVFRSIGARNRVTVD